MAATPPAPWSPSNASARPLVISSSSISCRTHQQLRVRTRTCLSFIEIVSLLQVFSDMNSAQEWDLVLLQGAGPCESKLAPLKPSTHKICMLVHRALIGVDYSATCGDKTWFVINEELEIAVKYSTCTCTCRNGSLTTRATLQIQKRPVAVVDTKQVFT